LASRRYSHRGLSATRIGRDAHAARASTPELAMFALRPSPSPTAARAVASRAPRASADRASGAVARSRRRDENAPAAPSWRQTFAASLAGAALFNAAAPSAALAIDLVFADPSVKEYMDMRDDAMRMKCEGGMMDCDGDRREYARAQSENFVRRNSGDERELPPCRVEEACTTDILGAAIAGVNGLTTSEKLEKMGRDADAVNGTKRYFGE